MRFARRPVLAGMIALGAATAARAQAAPLDGEWWGLLTYAGASYRLRVVLSGNSGMLYSVDEGTTSYPLDNVVATADGLAFGIAALGVTYRGAREGATIVGDYGFAGAVLKVTFQRGPLAYPTPFPPGTPDPALAGEWFGGGGMQGQHVKLTVAESGLRVDFLDRGGGVVPDIAAFDGTRVFFRIGAVAASFLGRLADKRIVGTLAQGGQTQPLTFKRTPDDRSVEPLTQALLEELHEQSGAPALAAAAVGPASALSLVAGVRNAVPQAPATPDDPWHMGSNTKAMTATLVARLAEAGRLSWNDTVGDVLGRAIPEVRPEYRTASFRHLCSHHAGLPRELPIQQMLPFAGSGRNVRADRLAIARLALQAPPAGPVGQGYLYSNDGYVIVGAMLETIMDARWEDLIAEHVFKPLGMKRTGIGPLAGPDTPQGHTVSPANELVPLDGSVAAGDILEFIGPAGRVHAPLDDMLCFLAAHRDRTAFLNPESWEILHTPPFGGEYAMGWVVRPDGLWHNGSITTWYAEMGIDRRRGACAVAECNLGQVRAVSGAVSAAEIGFLNRLGPGRVRVYLLPIDCWGGSDEEACATARVDRRTCRRAGRAGLLCVEPLAGRIGRSSLHDVEPAYRRRQLTVDDRLRHPLRRNHPDRAHAGHHGAG